MLNHPLAILLIAFAIVIQAGVLAPLSADSPSKTTEALASANIKLTDLQLTDHLGKEWKLQDFGTPKAMVFAFIGTQCPLAKLYTVKLVELEKKYRDKGVVFVAVDSNVQDSLAEMTAHAKKHGLEFAFLKDPSQALADKLGATRTPEVVLIDEGRNVRYRGRIDDQFGIGYTRESATKTELVDAVESLLKGKEITTVVADASGCLIGRGSKRAASSAASNITYAEHVGRILQARCVECHRPNEIGPMDLSNYDEASAWADMIAEVVDERRMPPWHASPDHGAFSNDRRLSEDEIAMIKSWAKDGAPRGDASREPQPMSFVAGWQLPREPDIVIPMASKPFVIPARGEVRYQYFVADPQLKEDTWVNGMEIIPGNRSVVHHILVFIRPKGSRQQNLAGERGFLTGYVPGTRVAFMPEGMAKRIPGNSEIIFQVHYTPNGSEQTDLSKVGFWIADRSKITHEIQTTSAVQTALRIPPREANYKTSALLPERLPDCELLSMSPHMHVRGKSFRYTAIYPTGEREVLLDVPKYDFNWQTEYRLKDNKPLPKGTRILCDAVYDNSADNLNNPNPDAFVSWGDQTYEEMMIGYFHISTAIDPKLGHAPELEKMASQRPSAMQIFEMLDTDRDDKVSKSQVPAQLRAVFDRLDKNKDGILEKSEIPK